MGFPRAIGTLEAGAFGELLERLLCDDVAAGHHHGGVGVGGLFFCDGADEDGVEVVGWGEGDFGLYLHVRVSFSELEWKGVG